MEVLVALILDVVLFIMRLAAAALVAIRVLAARGAVMGRARSVV